MRVVVAREQPGNSEAIRQLLLGMGLECAAGDCVVHGDLPVRLAQNPTDLVLVQVASEPSKTSALVQQALPLTKAPVLVFGPATEAEQIVEYLRSGAREFLDEGQLQENLERALERLSQAGTARKGAGMVIGVVSPTAGSGVTTVATNLAFAYAGKHKNEVALLELGRGPADLALALDLKPRHTVADVHRDHDRLDSRMLRQSMLEHPGGVQILVQKPGSLRVDPLPPATVRKSVILLRTIYNVSVLDLGHELAEEHYEALRVCDFVVVVVRLDVPSLKQVRRFVADLESHGVTRDRIRLVANRYGQRGQVPWSNAEEATGGKFAGWISEDPARANSALNNAQPIVQHSRYAKVTRLFYKLADQLNGKPR
jgi:Flp pilus assembly CpaE family ATPase